MNNGDKGEKTMAIPLQDNCVIDIGGVFLDFEYQSQTFGTVKISIENDGVPLIHGVCAIEEFCTEIEKLFSFVKESLKRAFKKSF